MLLHGFLSKKLREVIGQLATERIASKSAQLTKVSWRNVCFPVWNQRNELLHLGISYVSTKENEVLEETQRMIEAQHRELIHCTQYHLVDYTEEQITGWERDTKREMVNILMVARVSYAELTKKGDPKQSLITDYWK